MRIDEDDFTVAYLDADGPLVSTADDASDLIGAARAANASLIALPAARLDPGFVGQGSLLSGEMLRKLVDHRLQLVVLGDISNHLAGSDALRQFVWESKLGDQVWFVADREALEAKLAMRRAS